VVTLDSKPIPPEQKVLSFKTAEKVRAALTYKSGTVMGLG
jgi:hypothetical protein